MSALEKLVALLRLEKVAEGLFQGQSEDLGFPQVFGGQIIAQALSAAMQVVAESYHLHSCHTYFLRGGDVRLPIFYQTEILRQGKRFTAVNINAMQNDQLICRVMASFQVPEEGLTAQRPMPTAPTVAECYSENYLMQTLALTLPSPWRETFAAERAFDVRIQYLTDPFVGKKLPAHQNLWVKTQGQAPRDLRLQQCLLAYFSDFHCIMTMLQPHGKAVFQAEMKIATIDHSLWFHRPVDWTDYLLFHLNSPTSAGARGITRGEVFDASGQLLVSYQQEGLIREQHAECQSM